MRASVISLVLVTMLVIASSEGQDDLGEDSEESIDEIIKQVDIDGDGFINLEEFVRATNATVDSLPSEFDSDDDGKYNYQEFINALFALALDDDEE